MIAWLGGLLLIALLPGMAGATTQGPFNREELLNFIPQSKIFVDWCRENHHVDVIKNILDKPESVYQHQLAANQLRGQKQDPGRFAYILNHVILAGIGKDMGGDGSGKLAYLVGQRNKLLNSSEISEQQRTEELRHIDSSIAELKGTSQRLRSIPMSELQLMWAEREQLEAALMGRIPIERRVLPKR